MAQNVELITTGGGGGDGGGGGGAAAGAHEDVLYSDQLGCSPAPSGFEQPAAS